MRLRTGSGLLVRRKRRTYSGNERGWRMPGKMMMGMKQNNIYVAKAVIGVYANRLLRQL